MAKARISTKRQCEGQKNSESGNKTSELKNSLKGFNSNQSSSISKHEDRSFEITESEDQEEKMKESEQNKNDFNSIINTDILL